MVDEIKAPKAKTPLKPPKAPIKKEAPKPDPAAAANAALPGAINPSGGKAPGDKVVLSGDKKAPEPDFNAEIDEGQKDIKKQKEKTNQDIDATTEHLYKVRPNQEREHRHIDTTDPYDK